MSTSTMASRKSCGTADSAATTSSWERRSSTRSSSTFPTRTIDVEVRQDAEKPGAQIRAGRVGAPAAKRPRIGLLHQVLRLLARGDQATGDPVNLVGKFECLLFETDTVTRFGGQPARLGIARDLAHPGHPTSRAESNDPAPRRIPQAV